MARVMAASMGHHMVAVGKKSQVRLDGEMKKSLCKVSHCLLVSQALKWPHIFSPQGCGGLLITAVSADVKLAKLNRKEKIMKLTCQTCRTQKKIFLSPKPKNEKKRR